MINGFRCMYIDATMFVILSIQISLISWSLRFLFLFVYVTLSLISYRFDEFYKYLYNV